MRKLLILLFASMISTALLAQKEPLPMPSLPRSEDDTSLVQYKEVIEMPGVSTSELYKRGVKWYKGFYPNPAAFFKESDSVAGKILLLPQFPTYRTLKNGMTAQSAVVRYYIELGFKEGKYRYNIYELHLKGDSYVPIEKLFNAADPLAEDNYNTLTEADKYFKELIIDLKKAMNIPSLEVKKDEW